MVKFFLLSKNMKLSVRLIKHHAFEMYWVVEVWLRTFIIRTLDGVQWSD